MRLTVTVTLGSDATILDHVTKMVELLSEIQVNILKGQDGAILRNSDGKLIALWALED